MTEPFEHWGSAALAPHGLTHVPLVLLASIGRLAGRGTPSMQRAVADHAGAGVAMTSQVARSLEAKGPVARDRGHGDARRWRPRLTDDGAARLAGAVEAVDAADRELLGAAPDPATIPGVLRALARRDRSGARVGG